MKIYRLLFLLLGLVTSCVEDTMHVPIDTSIPILELGNLTEITFQQLYNLHSKTIGKDTVVSGYVVSSDLKGNFYQELYLQNTWNIHNLATNNPRMGLKIRIASPKLGTRFVKGRKVFVYLEGLKKSTSKNTLALGLPSSNFSKPILKFDIGRYIKKTPEIKNILPKVSGISELTPKDLNTVIQLQNVHFKRNEVGIPLAGLSTDDFDGERTLIFCTGFRRDSLLLETSNFASFSKEHAPKARCTVTGIYTTNFDGNAVCILNQFSDLKTTSPFQDCPTVQTPDIMISEVADPKVASGEKARYVTLYNNTMQQVLLKDWKLVRYNTTATRNNSFAINLDGLTIPAKMTLVIAHNYIDLQTNKTGFETYFGFSPNKTNANLDGNGDDAYELVDPLQKIKDVYGVPNVDGTGSVWDYEDGVAIRKLEVERPNAIFNIDEWLVYKKEEILSKENYNEDRKYSPKKR